MPAALTRTGVLPYSDGTRQWTEYRPPEEVFSEDSLASLRGAPVVDLHPDRSVTAENFKALSLGHVHDDVGREGESGLVVGTVTVNDAEACQRIDAGERREVSCGYTCEVDPTPGVTPAGERYDAVQRSIRYNHVGIGPAGWGRAGSDVALRLDGAAVEVRRDFGAGDAMKKIRLKSGREIKLDAAEDEVGAQGAIDDMQKKADADGNELAAVKAALMDSLQKVAALEAKQAAADAAAPPPVTEDMVPDEVADALVAKRGALRASAAKVLGAEVKLDGLSADEIRRRVVARAFPSVRLDGLSADRVMGLYEAAVLGASGRNDALDEVRAGLDAPTGDDPAGAKTREDGDPARALHTATVNRWQQPLTVSGAKG